MSTESACGPTLISYQLEIEVPRMLGLTIGRLGRFDFPAGCYVYTGSARRNLDARIARHCKAQKCAHWHIDYLLAAPGVRVTKVRRSAVPECALNQRTQGVGPIPGFGASDCRAGCGSHLKIRTR